ncbi:MAG TPA: 6,7-dimethyl-8-ribityllumazine synthase [Ignavibacteriaceae bacterium]|nr:6,7-dimethyl-8-ribityllumazine synthase [Ignavibacteriaceae bacterium]
MRFIEGNLTEKLDSRFAVIVSRFNEIVTDRLLKGALETFKDNNITQDSVDVFKVPGAFELPYAADRIAETGKYDAIVALGAVIRGETPHFEYVSSAATNGILEVSLKYKLPVIFGVLTTENIEQAMSRSGKTNNKGTDCVLAALEMVSLTKQIIKIT